MDLILAIITSLIIVFQNSYIFLFSIKEGVTAYSFLSLLPALISLIVLWSIYAFLKHKNYKFRTSIFLLCAILILGVLEFLLPVSPIKTTLESGIRQQAFIATVVKDITDEPLLSEKNNPIGIRIKYTAQVPVDGIYNIDPSIFSRKDKTLEPYQVQMGIIKNIAIEPAPSKVESRLNQFKANTVYSFTIDFVPTFLSFHSNNNVPCINFRPTNNFTGVDFKNWIEKNIDTQYEVAIEAGDNSYFTNRVVVKNFTTRHTYNVRDFYQNALKEGAKQCSF
jgi:hypothetical protein